jgi:ABC-type methionine transport system ATPase subunit
LTACPASCRAARSSASRIARALAAEPEIIICDEVTSALDQIVQEEILKLLMKLQKETNVSYLFITHDIATVRAISDEIVVMHQGKVVQQGPKTKVLNPPYPGLYRTAAVVGAGDGSGLADQSFGQACQGQGQGLTAAMEMQNGRGNPAILFMSIRTSQSVS